MNNYQFSINHSIIMINIKIFANLLAQNRKLNQKRNKNKI